MANGTVLKLLSTNYYYFFLLVIFLPFMVNKYVYNIQVGL